MGINFINQLKDIIITLRDNPTEVNQQNILLNTLSMSMGKTSIISSYLPVLTNYLNNYNINSKKIITDFCKYYGDLCPTWLISKNYKDKNSKYDIKIFDKWTRKTQEQIINKWGKLQTSGEPKIIEEKYNDVTMDSLVDYIN